VLPLVAGLSGDRFYQPAAMVHGFHVAMTVSATLAALGGVLAWLTISSDVLHAEDDEHPAHPPDFSCAVCGTQLVHPFEVETEGAAA
jgi:hypothetical protein